MSNYEPQGTMQQAPPPPAYYAPPPQSGIRIERGPAETRPFYLTSEFVATLLCVIGIAITGAIAADLDSHRASALIAGLVAAYTISRGIAKSGSRSHSFDPRENVTLGRGDNRHQ
jgi:hypothetical protein